jgi:LPS-assembly lipoprotein
MQSMSIQRAFRPLLCTIALMGAAALAGCGFTPLYATPGMTPSLDAIDVVVERPTDPRTVTDAALQTRVHFLLREQLDDELGHKAGVPTRYQLICTSKLVRIPRGVRVNNVANRYEMNFTVSYKLTSVETGKVLLQGTAPVIVEYDSSDPPYAGVAAEQDGENRAANQAAIAIRLDLSRYFAGVHSGSHAVETPVPGQSALDTPQ